jgi:hypothetical protein
MHVATAIVIAVPLAALVLTPWLVLIDRERAALAEVRKRLHLDPDSDAA